MWGAAYHIPPEHVEEVKSALDIREINGYSVDFAAFYEPVHIPSATGMTGESNNARSTARKDSTPSPFTCLVYIGLPSNPQFLGPQDPAKLAAHIARSRGPSGENSEYVYNLAAALEDLKKEAGVPVDVDDHVTDLAQRVRIEETLMKKGGNSTGIVGDEGIGDGKEEVEKL